MPAHSVHSTLYRGRELPMRSARSRVGLRRDLVPYRPHSRAGIIPPTLRTRRTSLSPQTGSAPPPPDTTRPRRWAALALSLTIAAGALGGCGGGGDDNDTGASPSTATTAAETSPDPVAWSGEPVTGELGTGDVIASKRGRVAPTGGTISFDGGPVDGLRVEFPEGAYAKTATVEVTAREIQGHTFGDLVDPVSPLLTIEGAPGVAEGLVELTVPVTVADDHFAMGFYYDARTRSLEGVPPVAQEDGTITLLTRHFSSIFVSQVLPDQLPEGGETMFLSGSDGWQFTNYGSFVSRGGHCAGMTISAMWYWEEQKNRAGERKLHGRFDDSTGDPTPSFWQDDSQAIRFVSTVQEDAWWGNWIGRFFRYLRTQGFDRLQWTAFRYAMTVTGQPQYVTIAYPSDKDPAKVGGGHALVAYAYTTERLYVYDPNHPRKKRYISWDDAGSKFLPYNSALKAGDTGRDFPWVGYAAKSALTDWDGIGRRYQELLAGTAGNDRFPRYKLYAVEKQPDGSEKFFRLGDGYSTDRRTLTVMVEIAGRDARATAYNGTRKVGRAAYPKTFDVPLRQGRNALGFLIEGSETQWDTWEYVDFTRLSVTRTAPVATTTTSTTTTQPPTTAPPTTAAPPATTAPPFDCSACPPGIAGTQCRLRCQAIGS